MLDGVHKDITLPGYTVLECLARDSYGVDLKARADVTGGLVVIHAYPEASEELCDAFRRFSPHFGLLRDVFDFERIPRVREMGIRDGLCYCVSDYVEGYDVAAWLDRKGVLDESDVMLVGQYAAEALAHVWNEGRVVHGDLKPADLLVTETGKVKLRYFSSYTAVMAAARHSGMSRPQGPYIAPEIRSGESAPTPRSDMYALGMILLHLLTGKCPPTNLVRSAAGNAADRVLTRSETISRPLLMLLRKLTARDPLARYHNWSGVLADMALIERGRLPDSAPPLARGMGVRVGERPVPRRQRTGRRAIRFILGTFVVLVCAATVVCHLSFRDESIPPKPRGRIGTPVVLEKKLADLLQPEPEPSPREDEASPPPVMEEPPEDEVAPPDDRPNAAPHVPEPPPAWHVSDAYSLEGVEDYVLIMHDVMELGGQRRFEDARAMLNQWLAINPESPYVEHVENEEDRLNLVIAAFDRVLEARMLVRGASIEAQPGLRGAVTDVHDGQLWVTLKYEHGEVETGVRPRAVTEEDLATLLKRVSPATYAEDMALYLAAAGQAERLNRLAKDGQVAAPLRDRLEALAKNRHFLTNSLESLDTLVRVGHLIDAGLYEVARDTLTEARRRYTDTLVFSQLRKEEIARLEKRISDGLAELKEVFTDGKEFSVATLDKPDRRSKLALAFKLAIEQGRWREYGDFLGGVLLNALKARAPLSRARQYEHVLADDRMRNTLNQAAFVQFVTPATLVRFCSGGPEQAFVRWLLQENKAVDAFLHTVKPEDDLARVLHIWQELWHHDPKSRDTYLNLALACAVVFDNPTVTSMDWAAHTDSEKANAPKASPGLAMDFRRRYAFYTESDRGKRLKVRLTEIPADELVWVVDAPVAETELRWAQKHVNYSRRDWGRAYGHIRYRMDKARGELAEPLYENYTLEQIEKRGGVCSDQAYFCVISAKANGIPAMVISGAGQRGPHAWIGYKATAREWNLDTGRYDGYPVGTTRDPQTGRMLRGWELSVLATSRTATTAHGQADLYVRLAGLFTRHEQFDEARQAFRMALDVDSRSLPAWNAYVAFLAQMDAGTEEWEGVITEFRRSFRSYPDMLAYADRIEEERLFPHMDASDVARILQTRLRRGNPGQGGHTELLCENIRQQAGIFERSGNVDSVMRVFEEGLDDLGGERAPFMEVSNSFLLHAQRHGRRRDALRVISRAFRRHFPGSQGDYFEMKEHQKMLFWLADLHDTDGAQSEAERYRRDADRIGRRL